MDSDIKNQESDQQNVYISNQNKLKLGVKLITPKQKSFEAFGLFYGAFGPFGRPTVSISTTNEFLSLRTYFLRPNMLTLP